MLRDTPRESQRVQNHERAYHTRYDPHRRASSLSDVILGGQDGLVNVRGVFLWTLVDNFEWLDGWGLRFGLYALDERTQQRTLRPSGALYAAIARANAIPGAG